MTAIERLQDCGIGERTPIEGIPVTPSPEGSPCRASPGSGPTPGWFAAVVSLKAQRLKLVLSQGMVTTVACTTTCTIRATLTLDARTAKKPKLKAEVGSATATGEAGATKVTIRLRWPPQRCGC